MNGQTGLKLSGNTAVWNNEIMGYLAERSNKLVDNIMTSVIVKSDFTKGDITGYIVLSEHKGYIPMIVRNFRLKPLDIILSDGKFYVIDDRTVDDILFAPKMSRVSYKDPKDVITSTDITHVTIPPATSVSGLGSQSKRVNVKAGQVSLGAFKCASQDTKREVLDILTSDKPLLKKIAFLLPSRTLMNTLAVNDGIALEADNDLVTIDASYPMYIHEVAANKFKINIPNHSLTEDGMHGLRRLLSDSQKSSLLTEKEVLIHDPNESEVHTDIDIVGEKKFSDLNDYSVCTAHAVDTSAELTHGVMLPSVEHFNGCLTGQGLFIGDEDRDWIYSDCIPGIPQEVKVNLNDSIARIKKDVSPAQDKLIEKLQEKTRIVNDAVTASCNEIIDDSANIPALGDYGCFIAGSRTFEPFYISAIYKVSGGYAIAANTMTGQRIGIHCCHPAEYECCCVKKISPVLLQKYFEVQNAYKISGDFKYVKLGNKLCPPRSVSEANNMSYRSMDFGHLVAINKDSSGSYILKRADRNSDRLSKLECQFRLMTEDGVSPKQAELLTDQAPVKYIHKDSNLPAKQAYAALTRNEPSGELPKDGPGSQLENDRQAKTLGRPAGSKNKVDKKMLNNATGVNDSKIMDMILSLSVSGSDTSVKNYMINYLDDIMEAINSLAKTTLFVRMNDPDGLSDESLTFLLNSLNESAWNIRDFAKSRLSTLRQDQHAKKKS